MKDRTKNEMIRWWAGLAVILFVGLLIVLARQFLFRW